MIARGNGRMQQSVFNKAASDAVVVQTPTRQTLIAWFANAVGVCNTIRPVLVLDCQIGVLSDAGIGVCLTGFVFLVRRIDLFKSMFLVISHKRQHGTL